jgi:hypothetical protein
MKRPLIGTKDFKAFIGQREQVQRRSWRLTKGEGIMCMWKEGNIEGNVKKNFFSSYVWISVHGKGVCKNQTWKEVVCNKYL